MRLTAKNCTFRVGHVMHCLYCNKRLWLFFSKERLFCSKLHEAAYYDELSAMDRLKEFTVPAGPAERPRDRRPETVPAGTRVQDTHGLAGCYPANVQLRRQFGAPETRCSRFCGRRCAPGGRTVRREDSNSIKPKRPNRLHTAICNRRRWRDRYDGGRADHFLPRAAKARPQNFSAKSRRIQFADASAKTAMTRRQARSSTSAQKTLGRGTGSSGVPARIGHFLFFSEIAYSN